MSLPIAVKSTNWNAFIGPNKITGSCYKCQTNISYYNFECASINGIDFTVDKLRPICFNCYKELNNKSRKRKN